jgi:hypothetical protein
MIVFPELRTDYSLPIDELAERIKSAKNGSRSVLSQLEYHYVYVGKYSMGDFYGYYYFHEQYLLPIEEYEIVSKYAQEGNTSAEWRLEDHTEAINIRKKLLSTLERDKNFVNDCLLDDFCASSDIYRQYLQKHEKSDSSNSSIGN